MLHLLPYEVSRNIIAEISKQPYDTENGMPGNTEWNVLNIRLVSTHWDQLFLYGIERKVGSISCTDPSCPGSWKEYYQHFILKKFIPLYGLDVANHRSSLNIHDTFKGAFSACWENMQGTVNARLAIYFEDLKKISRSQLLLHKLQVKLNGMCLFVPELLSYHLLGEKSMHDCSFKNQIVIVDLGPVKKASEYTMELKMPFSGNESNDTSLEFLFLEFGEALSTNEWLWCNFHIDHLNNYLEHRNISKHITYQFRYGNAQKNQTNVPERNESIFCTPKRDTLISLN